jgi:hypothetical protein
MPHWIRLVVVGVLLSCRPSHGDDVPELIRAVEAAALEYEALEVLVRDGSRCGWTSRPTAATRRSTS